MKKYKVTIKAIVTKTYEVQAESEEDAAEAACEDFSVLNDGADEKYEQDILNIEETT